MNFKLFMMGIMTLLLAACGGDGGSTSTAQTGGTGSTISTGTTTTTTAGTNGSVLGTALPANSFEIGVIGDMPYREQSSAWTNVRNELNAAALSFVVHVGNLKAFNRHCDDTYYNSLLNQFNAMTHPLIYTPGENDWATCNRIDNGAYYFENRLSVVRSLLTSGTQSLGQTKLTLRRQSDEMVSYAAYPENSVWTVNNVTFATFHVVGYNNGMLEPNSDANATENAINNIQRTNESNARQAANLAWLTFVFAEAKASKGLMLFMHQGNPNWDYPPEARSGTVYDAFFNELTRLAGAYGKPVLVGHGTQQDNSISYFRADKPNLSPNNSGNLRQLNRVQVFGSEDMHWVRVLVNPDSSDVFYVQPEIIDANRLIATTSNPVGVNSCGFCADSQSFDIGVVGDEPISVLPDAEWNNLIDDMEKGNLTFAVHTGNIRPKTANITCNEGHYGSVLAKFNAFSKPFFYTPGENDWALCSLIGDNPAERLARLRQFFTAQGDKSFGQETLFVDSQSDFLSYRKYSENKMWSVNNVLFATLHTIGDTTDVTNTNNNLGTTVPRQNYFNNISGTDSDEFHERQAANLEWIHLAFQQAKQQNAPGIAFFTHGTSDWLDTVNPTTSSASVVAIDTAYGQLIELLRSEAISFSKPVLLVHGGFRDYFRVDKPLSDDTTPKDTTNIKLLENFTRVETFGGWQHANQGLLHNLAHWVRITVAPNHPDVFLIRAEIVDSN